MAGNHLDDSLWHFRITRVTHFVSHYHRPKEQLKNLFSYSKWPKTTKRVNSLLCSFTENINVICYSGKIILILSV